MFKKNRRNVLLNFCLYFFIFASFIVLFQGCDQVNEAVEWKKKYDELQRNHDDLKRKYTELEKRFRKSQSELEIIKRSAKEYGKNVRSMIKGD